MKTLRESCPCGGYIRIDRTRLTTARALLHEWRDTHPCQPRDNDRDANHVGAGAHITTSHHEPVGFAKVTA